MALAFYAMFFALNRLGLPLPLGIAFGIAGDGGGRGRARSLRHRGPCGDRRSGNLTFFIFTLICRRVHRVPVDDAVRHRAADIVSVRSCRRSTLSVNIAISDWDLHRGRNDVWSAHRALSAFLRFHREGQFMLAVAENAGLAELYGISAKRAYLVDLDHCRLDLMSPACICSARAPASSPNSPLELLLDAVIATLLGGMGRIFCRRHGSRRAWPDPKLERPVHRLPLADACCCMAFCSSPSAVFPRGFRLPLSAARRPSSRPREAIMEYLAIDPRADQPSM